MPVGVGRIRAAAARYGPPLLAEGADRLLGHQNPPAFLHQRRRIVRQPKGGIAELASAPVVGPAVDRPLSRGGARESGDQLQIP